MSLSNPCIQFNIICLSSKKIMLRINVELKINMTRFTYLTPYYQSQLMLF